MRGYSPLSGLVVLLLTLGVCCFSVSLPCTDGAPSPGDTASPAGTAQALSDLDGDGIADPVLFAPGNFHHHLELYLSRADERIVLPFGAAAGGHGSLSAQDLDGDGDTDLLWQGALPSHTVMVWLNEGAGRFECLCPPQAAERSVALDGPRVNTAHDHRPASALSLERHSSPGDVLTVRGDCHGAATRGSHRLEHIRILSSLKRLLSTRSPPLSLC